LTESHNNEGAARQLHALSGMYTLPLTYFDNETIDEGCACAACRPIGLFIETQTTMNWLKRFHTCRPEPPWLWCRPITILRFSWQLVALRVLQRYCRRRA